MVSDAVGTVISAQRSECQRGEKFKQARKSNYDPLKGSQMMSPRLTTIHHSTTDMQQHHTKDIIPSSTDAGPLHPKWHEACTGTPGLSFCMIRASRQPANGTRPTHFGTQGKSGPCTKRANWTSDHCHGHCGQKERRDVKEKKEREERKRRKRREEES